MATATEDIYCTLLMSDSYLPGAAVLAHSLRDAGTKKKIAVLVTLDSLLYNTITELKKIFDYVLPVEKIANPHVQNLARIDRLDLRFAFTKLALWKQEQFRKIVYIDADVVALRAPDELFDLDHAFAAAPDIGWPDIFNSGVMLLTPNQGDYRSLSTLASSGASFDGADQGLFNEYFSSGSWHRLSFTYNCTPSSSYQYEPAYRHFRSSIKMLHFIGKKKPWQQGRKAMNSARSSVFKELVGRWWSVYDKYYKTGQTSALGQISIADYHLQQFVMDEESNSAVAWATNGRTTTTEMPLTSANNATEASEGQPPWDATKSAPPSASKAEAAGFPSQKYGMSSSTGLFHAPTSYPEPPKDIDYQITPRTPPPNRPPPIFPWEQHAQKPTRVFADPPQPTEVKEPAADQSTAEGDEAASTASGAVPLEKIAASADVLDAFSRTNAWDNNISINQYVRAVREAQNKGGVQVLKHDDRDKTLSNVSYTGAEDPESKQRRPPRQESLILTDFPTEVERPSLPVTPAPIGRSFWGGERDEQGELPPAEGVPDQKDWNPHEKLEQLRRASVTAAEELPKQECIKDAPLRSVPETSSELPAASSDAPDTSRPEQKTTSVSSTEAKE